MNPSLDEAKLDCRSGYVYPDSENVFECQTIWKDSISLSCVEACGEACVECGACSEEKFLESNELGAWGLAFILIIGILVGCAFLNFVYLKCCEG